MLGVVTRTLAPVEGIEYEMDVRAVMYERLVDIRSDARHARLVALDEVRI